MKHLVVTADDFGISREVNEAVEVAHREGILTAASLMVAGPAAADAVVRARRMPSLHVGLHLDLLEGACVAPPGNIADLVDQSGRFRGAAVFTGTAIALFSRIRRQAEREIVAQLSAFRATGLRLDHLDGHKHFHVHPALVAILARVAPAHGVHAIRVPIEPHALLCAVEQGSRRGTDWVLAPLARRAKARFAAAGIVTPDAVFGLAWSGAMTAKRLQGLIRHLPEGLNEIYCHPATAGGFAGAATSYRYAEELAALRAPAMREAVRERQVRLGGFADFPAPAP